MTLMTDTEHRLSAWDLSELMPDPSDASVAERLAALERAVAAFEARRGEPPRHGPRRLPRPAARVRGAARADERPRRLRLAAGSPRTPAAARPWPPQPRAAGAHRGATTACSSSASGGRASSDDEAEALLPRRRQHADYRHYLLDLRRFKPYTLDERSEQIINLKDDNGIGAVLTLYSMLTNRLEFHLEVDGETKTLTRDG